MALDTLETLSSDRIKDGRYSTGISVFDNESLQGIPAGTMVGILSDPRATGSLFNYHLVHTDRDTQYISTSRPARFIKEDIKKIGTPKGSVTIADAIGTSESTRDLMVKHSARLKPGHNFILETATGYQIEAESPSRYLKAIRSIYTNIHENDAIGYLHFANNNPDKFSKEETEAIQMCDALFNVRTFNNGDKINTELEILKLRCKDYPDQVVKLKPGRTLSVDTTRDIA